MQLPTNREETWLDYSHGKPSLSFPALPRKAAEGYVHEVDHAAAGLEAEALGTQVFVCKKKKKPFSDPGRWGLTQAGYRIRLRGTCTHGWG